MFCFYNANPIGRRVNDCTVRAISLAINKTWDETYDILSGYAKEQAIMMDEVEYIDDFLKEHFEKLCGCKGNVKLTVGQFIKNHPYGTFLITMRGHITCCKDGCIYDTFNPSDRFIWDIYKVKE